jgi:hypothetical protein
MVRDLGTPLISVNRIESSTTLEADTPEEKL